VTTPAPTPQMMAQTHGSFELVVSPLLLALLGLWLDRSVFGTTPVLTIVFAILGLVGALIKIFYTYRLKMAEHAGAGVWNGPARAAATEAQSTQAQSTQAQSTQAQSTQAQSTEAGNA